MVSDSDVISGLQRQIKEFNIKSNMTFSSKTSINKHGFSCFLMGGMACQHLYHLEEKTLPFPVSPPKKKRS